MAVTDCNLSSETRCDSYQLLELTNKGRRETRTEALMAPSVLFHYTSQKGLMGILNERAMWASSILYLNDAAEYSHAIEILKNEAADLRSSVPIDDAPGLDLIIEYTQSALAQATFVCCFSENGDLLSQWRGYCPSGGGYSIGFDYNLLRAAADDQGFALQQCIYDIDHQKSLVRPLLTKSLSTYHRLLGRSELTISQLTMNEFMHMFQEIAPQLKHPSFSEEREWRLVVQRHGPAADHFREGKTTITPYDVFQLPNPSRECIIPQIIIGPTLYPELSRRALRELILFHEVKGCSIVESSVPYRP